MIRSSLLKKSISELQENIPVCVLSTKHKKASQNRTKNAVKKDIMMRANLREVRKNRNRGNSVREESGNEGRGGGGNMRYQNISLVEAWMFGVSFACNIVVMIYKPPHPAELIGVFCAGMRIILISFRLRNATHLSHRTYHHHGVNLTILARAFVRIVVCLLCRLCN